MKPDEPLDLYQRDQTPDVRWVVKRETIVRKKRSQRRTNHAREKLRAREWGGEEAMRRYCTAAVAQILMKRLGRDLNAFLAVADDADLHQVIGHLRAASLLEADAASSARGSGNAVDEPPLPFAN